MVVNAGPRPSILMLGADRYPMQACLTHVVLPEGGLNRDLRGWQQRNWPDADFSDRLWTEPGRAAR